MYEVYWTVDDGEWKYDIYRSFKSWEEANEFVEELKHDDATCNYEICGGDEY